VVTLLTLPGYHPATIATPHAATSTHPSPITPEVEPDLKALSPLLPRDREYDPGQQMHSLADVSGYLLSLTAARHDNNCHTHNSSKANDEGLILCFSAPRRWQGVCAPFA
jgi:hypothetical protein